MLVRVRVQCGEAACDVGSRFCLLGLEEPIHLPERQIVGQHPHRDFAIMPLQAMTEIVLLVRVPRLHVQVQNFLQSGYKLYCFFVRCPAAGVVRNVQVGVLFIRVQFRELM